MVSDWHRSESYPEDFNRRGFDPNEDVPAIPEAYRDNGNYEVGGNAGSDEPAIEPPDQEASDELAPVTTNEEPVDDAATGATGNVDNGSDTSNNEAGGEGGDVGGTDEGGGHEGHDDEEDDDESEDHGGEEDDGDHTDDEAEEGVSAEELGTAIAALVTFAVTPMELAVPTGVRTAEDLTTLLQGSLAVDHLVTIAKAKGAYAINPFIDAAQAHAEMQATPEPDRHLLASSRPASDGRRVYMDRHDGFLDCSVYTPDASGEVGAIGEQWHITLPLDSMVREARPDEVSNGSRRVRSATKAANLPAYQCFPEYDSNTPGGAYEDFDPNQSVRFGRTDLLAHVGYAKALQRITMEVLWAFS